ncbi:ribonuclease H-like domain-containing protein, partial [Tanacetum coccineum]
CLLFSSCFLWYIDLLDLSWSVAGVHCDKPLKDKGVERGCSELKLDVYNPLFLHHNDIGSQLITFKLERTENYKVWATIVQLALHTRNKLGFINGKTVRHGSDGLLEGNKIDRKTGSFVTHSFIDDQFQKLIVLISDKTGPANIAGMNYVACSFMLCDLDFEPLSLSLSSMPSCDLVSLTNMLILFIILKALFQSLRKSLSLNLELS